MFAAGRATTLDTVLVRVVTDSGVVGWGEALWELLVRR